MNISLSVSVLWTGQGREDSVSEASTLIIAAHKSLIFFVRTVSVHKTSYLQDDKWDMVALALYKNVAGTLLYRHSWSSVHSLYTTLLLPHHEIKKEIRDKK